MFYNLKTISIGKKKISGRNNQGRITIRRRGGGHKRRYVFVDFFRTLRFHASYICGFSYDPNRSAFLSILSSNTTSGPRFHSILQAKGMHLGMVVSNFFNTSIETVSLGSSYFISALPVGAFIHNLERCPNRGGQLIRAAGCFGQVVLKQDSVLIKLPSGNICAFSPTCRAVFGVLSNETHSLVSDLKAGKSRWLGRRPSVRGVAINPIDHPHGGGEGKSKVGRHPVSAWGRLTKGKKTRHNSKKKYFLFL